MKRHRRVDKLTRNQKRIKNRVTLRTLFLVSVTLIFNTYAWFLYVNTVSANLTAHVDAWHVNFEVDDVTVDRQFDFEIDDAFPGMPDQTKVVSITNNGEKAADISYSIRKLKIFDEQYISSEAVASGETVPTGAITTYTAAQLLNKIENDYPFKLTFVVSSQTIAVSGTATLTLTFEWDYEITDANATNAQIAARDAADTTYGTQAYSYSSNTAIEITVDITASQHQT